MLVRYYWCIKEHVYIYVRDLTGSMYRVTHITYSPLCDGYVVCVGVSHVEVT